VKVTTALWLVLIALVVAAVAVFAVDNAQAVEIRFLSYHQSPSLALVIIGAFLCGGVVVAAASLPGRVRLALRLRHLERRMAAANPGASPGGEAPAGDGAADAVDGASAPGQVTGAGPAAAGPAGHPAPQDPASPLRAGEGALAPDAAGGRTPHPPTRPGGGAPPTGRP
jgi:uncharacterized integral membrane protein